MAAPHVAGAAALLLQRHPSWTPRQVKSALVVDRRRRPGPTRRGRRRRPCSLEGGGLVNVAAADDPLLFTDPASLSFGDLNVNARRRREVAARRRLGRRRRRRARGRSRSRPQSATGRRRHRACRRSITVAAGRRRAAAGHRRAPRPARRPARTTASSLLRRGDGRAADPVPLPRHAARPRGVAACRSARSSPATRRRGASRAAVYRYPAAPFGPPPDYTGAADERGRRRARCTRSASTSRSSNFGAAVDRRQPRARSIAPVVARLAGRERRPGLRGHAGQRERAHVRLPASTSAPPAPPCRGTKTLLRRRRLRPRPVHRPGASRPLRAALVGRTTSTRRRSGLLTTRVSAGRPTLVVARRSTVGAGRRPALARDRLRPSARRRGGLRPGDRARGLPAPARGAARSGRAGGALIASPRTSRRRRTSTRPATTSCRTRLPHVPDARSSAGRR